MSKKKETAKPSAIDKPLDPEAVLRAIEEIGNIRPYRLFDSKTGSIIKGRYYRSLRNALNGALYQTKWLYIGAVIQVYDVITGKTHAEYKRHANTISFTK